MDALGLSPEVIQTVKTVGILGERLPGALSRAGRVVGIGCMPWQRGGTGLRLALPSPAQTHVLRSAGARCSRQRPRPRARCPCSHATHGIRADAHPRTALAWSSLELVSYVLLRPFFLQLLGRNPKIADNPAKKAETATQMLPRVVCFIHNLVQVRAAIKVAQSGRE
jgi:hypothetical protein